MKAKLQILVTLLLCSGVFAQQSPQQSYVELILDASGSMWNTLEDGEYRITAAKAVLSQFIAGLPTGDLHVGLRVYGSQMAANEAGACEDTKLFVPLEGVDKAQLQTTVDSVNARGATPIARSLQAAANDFPSHAGTRMLILVTDGEESCGGDLQAVAAQLRAQGIAIDLKVIGFALTPEAAASFDGVGEFVNANDVDELAQALDNAVDEVVDDTPAVARATVTLNVPTSANAAQSFVATYTGDIQDDDYLTIVASHDPDTMVNGYSFVDATTGSHTVAAPTQAGNYEVRYLSHGSGEILARAPITINPSNISLEFPNEVSIGGTFAVNWQGPNGANDYIDIAEVGASYANYFSYEYTQDGTPITLTAPPRAGNYEVRYITGQYVDERILYKQPITVLPSSFSLDFPSNVPMGSNFEVHWQGPNGADDYIDIAEVGASYGSYFSYTYTQDGTAITLTAPPRAGSYEVRYITGQYVDERILYKQAITVTPVTISLDAPSDVAAGSSFNVSWQGMDAAEDYIDIAEVGMDYGSYISYAYIRDGNPVTLTAPDTAGTYELRYITEQYIDERVLYRKTITVR